MHAGQRQQCSPRRPIIGVGAQFRMEFDRDIVAGFLTYATTQTDWHVSLTGWVTGMPVRPDCDGYLVRGAGAAAALPAAALARTVLVSSAERFSCPRVWVDDQAIGRLAAAHLLALSPRTLISATATVVPSFAHRHHAFVAATKEAGRSVLTVDLNRDMIPPFREENERAEIISALETAQLPLAIVCPDAAIAFRVLEAVHELGLTVPNEATIIACEEDRVAAMACRPPLSTIDCGGHRVGYAAAALLRRLLAGDTTVGPTTTEIMAPGNVIRRASTQPDRTDAPAVKAALTYMREHVRDRVSVPDIARRVGIPRRTLERLFQQAIGRSPAAQLLSMRLDRASELLLQSPLSVTDIASLCGFGSLANFLARFRTRYRCTPTAFRLAKLSKARESKAER